jgi:hypothetical protein
MDKEIENILASIQERDLSKVKSFEEIKYIRKKALYDALSDFVDYEKNQNKYEEFATIIESEECEYATLEDLNKNDIIFYLDYFIFYDIKLVKARVTSVDTTPDRECINICIGEEETYKKIKINSIIFRNLTDEDKAKISLIEILNK